MNFMKIVGRSFTIAALLVFSSLALAQSALRTTIELVAPNLPDSATIYVTGSLPTLGSWNPAAIKLPSVGGHTWRLIITLDRPTSIEYKFTRGSWASEAADTGGAPLKNFAARVSSPSRTRATRIRCRHSVSVLKSLAQARSWRRDRDSVRRSCLREGNRFPSRW